MIQLLSFFASIWTISPEHEIIYPVTVFYRQYLDRFMGSKFYNFLQTWPLAILRDADLATVFESSDARYSAVKRALANNQLLKLKRGVYVVASRANTLSRFQIANSLYGPSFVSFESAIAHHQWIPERIVITQSSCAKKAKRFETATGRFDFFKVPSDLFYMDVEVQNDCLVALPWRAISDLIYTRHKSWQNVAELCTDLRIEFDIIDDLNLESLSNLCKHYPSSRVRQVLQKMRRGLLPVGNS